ncbi:MAG: hypothetical protein A2Z66_00930 [Chloroflexi bacterium RBG_13_66_10]|nr:MAG: hypothetical protein A2Z66_00930 [Chloroflexi bacterium RBG_13_66_10]
MNRETVAQVSREVVRKFPEMAGIQPTVRPQGESQGQSQYLLVYKGRAELPGGRSMSRIVRVVCSDAGRIVRLSTSR